MACNCNNSNNGTSNEESIIGIVYGNVLRLSIPLNLRTIEVVDGNVETTDTDFVPSSEYPIVVEFGKGAIKIQNNAKMVNGNVVFIEDLGTIPVGEYSITISCRDDNGYPYRFKQNSILKVVDTTAELNIGDGIEYEVNTWYLDAAMFYA